MASRLQPSSARYSMAPAALPLGYRVAARQGIELTWISAVLVLGAGCGAETDERTGSVGPTGAGDAARDGSAHDTRASDAQVSSAFDVLRDAASSSPDRGEDVGRPPDVSLDVPDEVTVPDVLPVADAPQDHRPVFDTDGEAGCAAGTVVRDQSQPRVYVSASIFSRPAGQSFTVGVSGVLIGIEPALVLNGSLSKSCYGYCNVCCERASSCQYCESPLGSCPSLDCNRDCCDPSYCDAAPTDCVSMGSCSNPDCRLPGDEVSIELYLGTSPADGTLVGKAALPADRFEYADIPPPLAQDPGSTFFDLSSLCIRVEPGQNLFYLLSPSTDRFKVAMPLNSGDHYGRGMYVSGTLGAELRPEIDTTFRTYVGLDR